MVPLPIVLLPGLHGTGDLFEPFLAKAPPHLRPIVVPLPEKSSYAELLEEVRGQLPDGRFAILGESFSGPLAVALARGASERVAGVILCNSFISPPRSALWRFLPWSLLFRIPPPRWAVRFFLAGFNASPALVSAVRAVVVAAPRTLLAGRMHAIFTLPPAGTTLPMDVPALFLTGRDDVLVVPNPEALQKIAFRFTRKDIQAPHLLLQTAPAEAWDAISTFLAHGAPYSVEKSDLDRPS